ncbi:MAG: transporter [Gammaproteobacteria bacterium]|nr:transporter [Gammaproteobacteria bacterium]
MGNCKFIITTAVAIACGYISYVGSNELLLNCHTTDETNSVTDKTIELACESSSLNDLNQPIHSETMADDETSSIQQVALSSTIGEEPPEDISRLFLRDSEVLLKPREIQLSTGLNYSKNDLNENLRLIRFRDVSIPFSISAGITERLEVFATFPLLYAQSEFVAFNDSIKSDDNGIGDLTTGFSYKLVNESKAFPSVTGSISRTIPTGSKEDLEDSSSVRFTSNVTNFSFGLSMTKSVDPAVLFVNLGYDENSAFREDSILFKPGNSINYGFGAGFSINSAVSLSGRYYASYVKDNRVGDVLVVGSGSEPTTFNISLNYQINNKTRLETSLDFGLNDDANDSAIGFSYIYTLRRNRS